MNNYIIAQVNKELRRLFLGIGTAWTQPGDPLWIDETGAGLRLDIRYKGHEGGLILSTELIAFPDEAIAACVAQITRLVQKIERKANEQRNRI